MNRKGVVWQPMFYSILLMVIIVFILNLVVGYYTPIEELPQNSFLNSSANFVDLGFNQTLVDFPDWIPFLPDAITAQVNPFALFGDTVKDFVVTTLRLFSVVPEWLIYSLGTTLIIGFVLLVMSFIRGTG